MLQMHPLLAQGPTCLARRQGREKPVNPRAQQDQLATRV